MLYNYIKEHYMEAEPIFHADLLIKNITESKLNQQLKELCEKGLLQKYDEEVYFMKSFQALCRNRKCNYLL